MKTDVKGCSRCLPGEERFERFERTRGKSYVMYDYRTPGGRLFTCVAPTIEKCREKRLKWLKENNYE